jgi:hypothetical protein
MPWSGVTAAGASEAAVVAHAPTALRADTVQSQSTTRVWFVDALRLLAAFQMLQGHTLAALLAPEVRHGAWFMAWSNVRGLTSVCFLFTAGMAFYFATVREYAAHRASGQAIAKRCWRALRLIALGYALHLPLAWLVTPGIDAPPGAVRELLAVDVLQCIGVSLLLLELTVVCAPSVRVWLCLVGSVAVVFAFGTPWAYRFGLTEPHALAAYVGPLLGSQFPLWPWGAHMFAGVLVAAWVSNNRSNPGPRLLSVGATLLVAGRLLVAAGVLGVVVDHVYRLGWVVVLATALAWATRGVRRPPAWLSVLATESLFLYVFHVVLVYGRPWGLGAWLGTRLSLAAGIAAALAVIAVSAAAALGFRALRSR